MGKKNVFVALFVAVIAVLLFPVGVRAACTSITAADMPYTISSSGNYCLTESVALEFSTTAVSIEADDVILDLGGFEIIQLSSGNQTGIAGGGRKNVIVKKGTLTNFGTAIKLNNGEQEAQANIVLNITANGGYIEVRGNSGVISNCRVRGNGSSPETAIMMRTGSGGRIENNDVYGAGLEGIYVNQDNAVVQNNVVGNASVISGSSGILVQNANVLLANNRITNMETGINFDSSASAKFRDTMTIGCTYPWTTPLPSGVTSSGGND